MLLLCCSLIPWIARGQAAYDWYYWFDSDDAVKTEGNSIGNSFSILTDASGLSQGFHTIHVQVVDTAGVYSPPKTEYFYHTTDRSVVALRYWFDNDMEHMQMVSASGSNYTIDVSSLEPGLHYIYCQIEDASGSVSDVVRSGFYRQIRPTAMTWTYWFDETESTKATVKYPGEAVMVDVSDLTDGFHTIHSQVQEITPSSVETRMFIKTPQTEGVGNMTCICTIDGNLVAQEDVPAQGGIMRWEMDVDSLDVGIHKAMFQAITPSGAASSIAERYFVRAITNKELGSMKCVYSLDNFKTSAQAGTLSNGLFHFDLDVSAMEDGLHRLAYMLVSENGVTTPQKTAFFWKTPLGGSGITQYDYWLNESKNVHSVTLDKRTNPFSLVKLLPVETEPIRSSSFQFEMKDGKPMLYAKNDFHIAFYDVTGRRVDESKQYVDYNTSAAVTGISNLKSTQTFSRLDDNNIKWFKFEAEEGDTLTFKTDQACTIQLFSPTGKELYTAMGEKSVIWEGCHTWENGTHYVAVHNTTGSRENVTLDFSHMAKYEIVSQDVRVVGNGGCSTITIRGNGFKDLYDVELIVNTDDGTNVLHPLDINHISDAEVGLTFDFSHVKLKYHPGVTGSGTADHPLDTPDDSYWESTNVEAVFHFTEKDRTMSNFLRVDEEKPIELATNVTFPSSYGHVVTYTCKITNKGNMTAYAVPIYIWMKSKQEQGIFDVRIEGLELPRLSDYVSSEVLTQSEVAEMKTALDAFDDDYYFMKFWVEDEDSPSDSVCVRSNYFFTNLAPGETKTLRLTISTSEVDAFAYFTLPEEWPSYSIESGSPQFMAKARFASAKSESWYCCYRDRIECVANIICNGLDIASLFSGVGPNAVNIASCAAGGMNQVLTAAGDHYCGKNDVEGDFVKKVNNIVKGINVAAVLTGCASAFGVKNASEIAVALDAVTHPFVTIDCLTSFFSKKPNCPPTPPDGGGTHGGKSHDPNEIYGYLSQSGSKFLADSVRNVNYRIEFENDTAFATASAHVVEVKDTLDGKYFDLATFAPTSVKIGDKVEYLDGTPNFVKTIDMRPAINAIAQVEGEYDVHKGIATWTFTSLDPMTMEPTDDIMQGFLPVNYDGESGIGEVMFDVSLKGGFADGTEIPNKASIVFDINEPILTPTWVNAVDAVCPESHVTNVVQQNDSIATIYFEGDDARSGVWKYNLYVQYGDGSSWIKFAECGADSSYVDFRYSDGLDYGFCVLATDSAGNVEKKELTREGAFVKVNLGDVNCDGEVNTLDASLTTGYYLEQPVYILAIAADVNGDGVVNTLDATQITQMYLNANNASRTKTMGTRKRLIKTKSTKQ